MSAQPLFPLAPPPAVLVSLSASSDLPPAREVARQLADRWLVLHAIDRAFEARAVAAPAIVWLVVSGELSLELEEARYALAAGDAFVTPRGERFTAIAGRDARVIALVPPFAATGPQPLIERTRVDALMTRGEQMRLVDALTHELPDPRLTSRLARTLYDRLLDGQCAHDAAVARTPGRSLPHRRQLYARLLRVKLMIDEGPTRDYAMPDLADVAALSVWHFVRTFRDVFGETPHRYLTQVRLARAAQRLATTDEPVAAIVAALGFENRCAFARLFRAHYGTSASEHRLRAQLARRSIDPRIAQTTTEVRHAADAARL